MDHFTAENPEKCSICHSIPEDILMLSCNHDLCLNCAAEKFRGPENSKGRLSNNLICILCGTPTQLDLSSVYELEKIEVTPTKKRNEVDRDSKGSLTDFAKLKPDFGKTPARSLNDSSHTNMSANRGFKGFCHEHPEEEISYYCFDCKGYCICPECIIHGVHKTHEVMTIKKAYPLIKAKVEDICDQLRTKVHDSKATISNLNTQKRELSERKQNLKIEIGQKFSDLRSQLTKKETECQQYFDNFFDMASKGIESGVNANNVIIGNLVKKLEDVSSNLNIRDEVPLLNFFSQYSKNTFDMNNHSAEAKERNYVEAYWKEAASSFKDLKKNLEIFAGQLNSYFIEYSKQETSKSTFKDPLHHKENVLVSDDEFLKPWLDQNDKLNMKVNRGVLRQSNNMAN